MEGNMIPVCAGRTALALGLFALAALPVAGLRNDSPGQAQTPAAAPPASFEVASIKPSKPGTRGYSVQPLPGRLHVANTSLRILISEAYHVYDFQVTGGPKWLDEDRWDIEAKAAGGT